MNDYPPSPASDAFAPGANDPAPRYGLPQEVEFCQRCVISNQRPTSTVEFKIRTDSPKTTIHFDDDGICDACRFVEHKQNEIDWPAREEELRALCDRHRRTDGNYDCVVPGSGGKDSVYAAHVLKYKYHMHPLTVTWAPHIYTDCGWRNFQAWLQSGFDNQLFTPNGRVHRLLTRLALEKLLHPFQPFVLGQKNVAPKVAARYGISLIFYGENEAEYGNPIADNASAVRDWSYFTAPDESERSCGTYSKYNSIDDKVDDLHYYTTFIKFGIGRATYDAAQEIRSGDITREEGIALVNRFDGEYPARFLDELLAYLSIPPDEFSQASNSSSRSSTGNISMHFATATDRPTYGNGRTVNGACGARSGTMRRKRNIEIQPIRRGGSHAQYPER